MSLLDFYHGMPPWIQTLAATARGAYLQAWRYGRDTAPIVKEALDRETWSQSQWSTWQQERLAFILHRAATRVPYYRDLWASRRARGYRGSWELIENWPILEKEDLRSYAPAFVADDVNPRRMFKEHTSGSTGTPIQLWIGRDALRYWYGLFEARWRNWNDVSRNDRWAILGGQLVTPVRREKPPFWVWNAAMRQMYMSSYHLSPKNVPHYLEALQRYRIEYLWGYTSSLCALASEILRRRAVRLSLRVVITNAEPLFEHQRSLIETAFGCPVRETYGLSEMVAAASECQQRTLHLWPEVGYLEVQPEASSSPGEITGAMICTGLSNPDMPLIRYRVGDRISVPSNSSRCGCGRGLPAVIRIEGRTDDALFMADGRTVGRLDPVFKGHFLVREAQIIQEQLNYIRLKYVPAPGCTEQQIQELVEQIRSRLGPVQVETERVQAIPRGPNNKFKSVICKLPSEQRRNLTRSAENHTVSAI